jgi:hypothetical protein
MLELILANGKSVGSFNGLSLWPAAIKRQSLLVVSRRRTQVRDVEGAETSNNNNNNSRTKRRSSDLNESTAVSSIHIVDILVVQYLRT